MVTIMLLHFWSTEAVSSRANEFIGQAKAGIVARCCGSRPWLLVDASYTEWGPTISGCVGCRGDVIHDALIVGVLGSTAHPGLPLKVFLGVERCRRL
jgi:hypothetical protein